MGFNPSTLEECLNEIEPLQSKRSINPNKLERKKKILDVLNTEKSYAFNKPQYSDPLFIKGNCFVLC